MSADRFLRLSSKSANLDMKRRQAAHGMSRANRLNGRTSLRWNPPNPWPSPGERLTAIAVLRRSWVGEPLPASELEQSFDRSRASAHLISRPNSRQTRLLEADSGPPRAWNDQAALLLHDSRQATATINGGKAGGARRFFPLNCREASEPESAV